MMSICSVACGCRARVVLCACGCLRHAVAAWWLAQWMLPTVPAQVKPQLWWCLVVAHGVIVFQARRRGHAPQDIRLYSPSSWLLRLCHGPAANGTRAAQAACATVQGRAAQPLQVGSLEGAVDGTDAKHWQLVGMHQSLQQIQKAAGGGACHCQGAGPQGALLRFWQLHSTA